MAVLLAVLSIIISGYTYLTDSNRVRDMAAAYLSRLLGGRVEIGKANLSIFEGLRLDRVRVHVDQDPGNPDSLLFSAQAFVINYDPRKLVAGQLDATEIIAEKPHVYLTLTQTAHQDRWNYHRLKQETLAQTPSVTASPSHRLSLPQILLRNAVVEISEVKAGQRCPVGQMYIDGQLASADDGERYQFELQTRGVTEGLGPYASGTIDVTSGLIDAHLHNVQFGQDIRSMFPADLRDWWERHDLSGRIKSVDLTYAPPHEGTPQQFRIQTTLQGVTLAVHREEWSSREEVQRWQRLQDSISLMRGAYGVAGFSVRSSLDVLNPQPQNPEPRTLNTSTEFRTLNAPPEPLSPVEVMSEMVDTSPLRLRDVSGTFVFTQDGIDVDDLRVLVSAGDPADPLRSNAFAISGHMVGYRPDAPLRLEISSADPQGLYFPARPKFLEALPEEVRSFYNDLKPQGTCYVKASVTRPVAGAMPQVSGEVEVADARFLFRQFPYPFQGASGKIAFGRDPFSGKDYVTVMNMHGRGLIGGPNEHAEVAISGRVGPLGPQYPEPGFDLHATGKNICSEPALMAAMPHEVRDALKVFDAPGKGEFPKFKGNFACTIARPPGRNQRWTFETDVDLVDASGRVVGFPYPLRHVHGKVKVHDGYVEVLNATMTQGSSSGVVTGTVRWADDAGHDQPLDLKLNVHVRGMPLDQDLLAAIPPEQAAWLKKLGVAGKIDVDGRLFTEVPPDWREQLVPGRKPADPPVLYDLAIGVHDGTIWPADGLFSVGAVTGKLHLTHDRLDILDLRGRRENGQLAASGWFTFTGSRPRMALHVSATNLTMDRPLYGMLPPDGKKAWDEVQPQGTTDAEVDYHGAVGQQTEAVATIAPLIELPSREDSFRAVLRPRRLSVRIRSVPYPLMFDHGSVTISGGKAVLRDLVGHHGPGTLMVAGTGRLDAASTWDLKLQAENLAVDKDLLGAMPPALLAIFDGLKLRGSLGLDLPHFSYRGSTSAAGPDIDIGGKLTIHHGSMDVGVPLARIEGDMRFQTASRQGNLDSLSGAVTLNSLRAGGRPLSDLRLDLLKSSGKNELHVDHVRADVAGGQLAGGMLITFPDQGANRYTMNLVLRNADVKQLTGEKEQDIRGQLTASLALEGAWGQSNQRRGRGDVVVAGKQLYRIPLVLGLLQITNLSLPLGGPFTHGDARYTVDGTRVNFEQMNLRSDSILMNGTGYLDFGSRQVRLTLTTDTANGIRIPFIHDLWQGARQQLLRIDVRGTVQSPRVEPSSLGIFTTTIDEVFKAKAPVTK